MGRNVTNIIVIAIPSVIASDSEAIPSLDIVPPVITLNGLNPTEIEKGSGRVMRLKPSCVAAVSGKRPSSLRLSRILRFRCRPQKSWQGTGE